MCLRSALRSALIADFLFPSLALYLRAQDDSRRFVRLTPDDRRLRTLDERERGLFDRRGEDRDLRRAGMCYQ